MAESIGGKERMSTETKQQDSEVHNQYHDILSAVVNLVKENKKFRGTAAELAKVLGLVDMNPRALVVQVNKLNGELENRGIFVKHSINRGRHLVTITNTHEITHSEETLLHPTQTIPKNSDFATPPKKEPITFPFSWLYGEIIELSEEEKNELNRTRHNGRKHYQKPCAVCGEEGILEYRKISDGNPALLCKKCSENYIISAIKLQQKMEENRR